MTMLSSEDRLNALTMFSQNDNKTHDEDKIDDVIHGCCENCDDEVDDENSDDDLTACEATRVPCLPKCLLLFVEVNTVIASRTFWCTLSFDLNLVTLVRQSYISNSANKHQSQKQFRLLVTIQVSHSQASLKHSV